MIENLKIYKQYSIELINLSLPLIMGNLGIILIGAGDVFVAGRYSTETLAAISVANAIVSCIFMLGVGLFISISPVISNMRGAKKPAKKYLIPSIKFSQFIALIVCLFTILSGFLIPYLGFEKHLVPLIQKYTFWVSISTFGAFLHGALKEYLQGYEIVFFPNFIAILGIFLNLFLNFVLVFGFWKIPSLGIIGLAMATIIVRTFMGLILLIFCLIKFNCKSCDKSFEYYKTLIKVGLPISLAILIEFLTFNAVTVLLARVSGIYAAAESIILVIVNIIFMVPLAISNSLAIKIGFTNGAKDFVALKKYAITGIILPILFMFFFSIVLLIFPHNLAGFFTTDKHLIEIVVPILMLVAFFQIFDSLQVSIGGIFKGLKRTNIIMLADFIGYMLISLPIGIFLGLYLKMNITGFWLGLLSGSMFINIVYLCIAIKHKKYL